MTSLSAKILAYYLANSPKPGRATFSAWEPTLKQTISEGLTYKEAHAWMVQHSEALGIPAPALATVRDWRTALKKKLKEADSGKNIPPRKPNVVRAPASDHESLRAPTEARLNPTDSSTDSQAQGHHLQTNETESIGRASNTRMPPEKSLKDLTQAEREEYLFGGLVERDENGNTISKVPQTVGAQPDDLAAARVKLGITS